VAPVAVLRSRVGPRRKQRTWLALGAAVATLAGLAAVGAWIVGGGRPPSQPSDEDAPAPPVVATPTLTLRGHTNTIECLAFVPGGNELVSGDDDQRILVWDLESLLADQGPDEAH